MTALTRSSRRVRRASLTALVLALGTPARAEDGDGIRYYLAVGFAESNPLTRSHDAVSGAIGANLNRYLGVELAFDDYELSLDAPTGPVAELDMRPIMPQLRVRYPLLQDRLVPYLVGGAGLLVTQVNDRQAPIAWDGGSTTVRPAGAVGVGIEYFFTDDIAFGTEGRYILAGRGTFTAAGKENHVSLDSALWTFGLRLFRPERHPSTPAARVAASTARFYLGARIGGALPATREAFPGVTADPEQAILGSDLTVLFGGAVGVNVGRYLGLELSIENRELNLHAAGVGSLGEYALFPSCCSRGCAIRSCRDAWSPTYSAGLASSWRI